MEIQEITEEDERPVQTASEARVEFEEIVEETPSVPQSRKQSTSSVTPQQSLEIQEVFPEEQVKPLKKKERKESVGRRSITESKGVEIEEMREVEKERVLEADKPVVKKRASVDVQRSEAIKSEVQVVSDTVGEVGVFTRPVGGNASVGFKSQKSLEVREVDVREGLGVVGVDDRVVGKAEEDIVLSQNIVTSSPDVRDSAAEFTGKFKPVEGRGVVGVEESASVVVRETVTGDVEGEFTGKFKPVEGRATPGVEESASLVVRETVAVTGELIEWICGKWRGIVGFCYI